MTDMVLIAEFPQRSAASTKAKAIVGKFGRSPAVKSTGSGWGLFAPREFAEAMKAASDEDIAAIPPSLPSPLPAHDEPQAKPSANARLLVPSHSQKRQVLSEKATAPSSAKRVTLVKGNCQTAAQAKADNSRISSDSASRMAAEIREAYRQLSADDAKDWLDRTLRRLPWVFARRVRNLANISLDVAEATGDEIIGLVRAMWERRAVDHITERLGHGSRKLVGFATSLRDRATPLFQDLKDDPANIAPDLLVASLAFYVSSGGFDGNGGIPDTDISLVGIGAHRSIFTHSIVAGAVVETALYSLLDFVAIAYRHLPDGHDRRWTTIYERLQTATNAGAKGMSAGLAYHLGVDGVVQPGAYHDLPFHMSIEGHQAILSANAAAEAIDSQYKHPEAARREKARPEDGTPRQTPESGDGKLTSIAVGAAALTALALDIFA